MSQWVLVVLAAGQPASLALAIAVIALIGTVANVWWTQRRTGQRDLYAHQTARNAAFQMAKRKVLYDHFRWPPCRGSAHPGR